MRLAWKYAAVYLTCVVLLALLAASTHKKEGLDALPDSCYPGQHVPQLKINEFVAKGSTLEDEFGQPQDWVELYNAEEETVVLEEGKWILTDDVYGKPRRFVLPQCTIPAKGFIVIWCSHKYVVGNELHANFKLDGAGEELALLYQTEQGLCLADYHAYSRVKKKKSLGRYPDGEGKFVRLAPSPNKPNRSPISKKRKKD